MLCFPSKVKDPRAACRSHGWNSTLRLVRRMSVGNTWIQRKFVFVCHKMPLFSSCLTVGFFGLLKIHESNFKFTISQFPRTHTRTHALTHPPTKKIPCFYQGGKIKCNLLHVRVKFWYFWFIHLASDPSIQKGHQFIIGHHRLFTHTHVSLNELKLGCNFTC